MPFTLRILCIPLCLPFCLVSIFTFAFLGSGIWKWCIHPYTGTGLFWLSCWAAMITFLHHVASQMEATSDNIFCNLHLQKILRESGKAVQSSPPPALSLAPVAGGALSLEALHAPAQSCYCTYLMAQWSIWLLVFCPQKFRASWRQVLFAVIVLNKG